MPQAARYHSCDKSQLGVNKIFRSHRVPLKPVEPLTTKLTKLATELGLTEIKA